MAGPQPTLPLDLTGLNPANQVVAEVHTVNNANGRTFALNYGAFFTDGIVLKDMGRNRNLIPSTDFVLLHLYRQATVASGKEVCQVIHVKNHITADVAVTYQAIGGEYSGNVQQIEDLIAAAENLDDRVNWGEILYLPNQFNPAAHMHHLRDMYGWEAVLTMMEELRLAIMNGSQGALDAVTQYVTYKYNMTQQEVDLLRQAIEDGFQLATEDEAGIVRRARLTTPLDNNARYISPHWARMKTQMTAHMGAYLSCDLSRLRPGNQTWGIIEINGTQITLEADRVDTASDAMPKMYVGNVVYAEKGSGGWGDNVLTGVVTQILQSHANSQEPDTPDRQIIVIDTALNGAVESKENYFNIGSSSYDVGQRYYPRVVSSEFNIEDDVNTGTRRASFGVGSVFRLSKGVFIVNFKPGVFQYHPPTEPGFISLNSAGVRRFDDNNDILDLCIPRELQVPLNNDLSHWLNINSGYAVIGFTRNNANDGDMEDPVWASVQFWERVDQYSLLMKRY